MVRTKIEVFVPYRGIYFLYNNVTVKYANEEEFSSPIGESTFSTEEIESKTITNTDFSSPIGESTFSTLRRKS